MSSPIQRAIAALEAAGYITKETDAGVVIRHVRSTGNEIHCGRIWQNGDRVAGRLTLKKSAIAIVLGDAGIRLDGYLAGLYGKRQLPTLGFVREEANGEFWAASGMGDRTHELGFYPSFGDAAEACWEYGCIGILPLKADQVGWDGVERIVQFLAEIGKIDV